MKTLATKQLRTYYQLWRETNVVYEEWAKAHGISYNALLILYTLWENPTGCTQTTICIQWTLPKQTVNTILKNLEKKSYIAFEDPIYDQRKRRVVFTDSGRNYASAIIPKLQNLELDVMERIGPERTAAMLESTALFIKYFKEGSSQDE